LCWSYGGKLVIALVFLISEKIFSSSEEEADVFNVKEACASCFLQTVVYIRDLNQLKIQ
jgi:hypothetical protein